MGKKDQKRQQHLERTRRRKERKRASETKKKRTEQKVALPAKKTEPIAWTYDYYLPAFVHFGAELRRQGYSKGPSWKRGSFWQLVTPRDYAPDEARGYLESYLTSLEMALKEVIERNSLAYWHHVCRRFAPLPIGEDKDPTTIQITRAVLDAAIQKYAQNQFCNRIGRSDQVDSKKILQGFLAENRAFGLLESLSSNPQFVLTDFGVDEYREFLETEKLAYKVWRTMAQLRTVGKGAPLMVTDGDEWVADDRSEDLEFLLSNFDQREAGFSASATGTVFGGDSDTKGLILLPRWNAELTNFDELGPLFESFLGHKFVTPDSRHGPNFVWTLINIQAYYRAHQPFSQPFQERNGVSLESVIAVIAALIAHLYVTWHRMPFYFLRMWQRAYDAPGKPDDIKRWLREFVPIAVEMAGLPFDEASVDIDAAFAFLSLTEESRSQIHIGYGGPHAVFIPNGADEVFIDYAYIVPRLHFLFNGVKLADQNFKGAALESFTHQGESVLPVGELRASDRTKRQVDAAFALGDTLVICECRATARSLAVEKGDPTALDVRKQLIERTLTDIDEKANWLRTHPVGSNYDVRSYQWVLPLGVTPFKEFIHSRDTRYWVGNDIPRILSPDELREAIDDGSLAAAAALSPNCVKLA